MQEPNNEFMQYVTRWMWREISFGRSSRKWKIWNGIRRGVQM